MLPFTYRSATFKMLLNSLCDRAILHRVDAILCVPKTSSELMT
jgi:hypothetical protein